MRMNRMLPEYSTMLFTDIWDEATEFVSDYKSSGLYNNVAKITDESAGMLYYLLFAKYGNSPIANKDVNQFQYKVFSIIFEYGPTWEKQLAVQKALRDLSADDIRLGSKAIYNSALNPQTAPSTSTLEELTYINQQNTTNYKKSPLEGYAMLLDLLSTDVTKAFIDKFKICFKTFVTPERPLVYVMEDEDDGN